MKKNTKLLGAFCTLLCGLFLFCSCGQPKYAWELGDLGYDVDFHTEAQKQYLAGDYTQINLYADATKELSRPEAVRLEWTATPEKENAPAVENYVVEISTKSDFSDSLIFNTKEEYLEVYNLYIATDYYWRVTAELEDGKKSTSNPSLFTTAEVAPRNIYVDGITNVRDLGGWETADGGRVKQGMIYRCGRLNTSISDGIVVTKVEVEITEQGIDTMRNQLGIKSQIDLRRVDNNEVGFLDYSPLGDDVNYYSRPMDWNVSNILTDNPEMVKEIFAILADENNYPLIYHCNIGTDRTGLFAYLINGLMGVSEEDLYRDYLFSNFGKINSSRTLSGIQSSYIKTIKSYPGDTLSAQIKNCLVALGVPAEHVDSVIEIMSED